MSPHLKNLPLYKHMCHSPWGNGSPTNNGETVGYIYPLLFAWPLKWSHEPGDEGEWPRKTGQQRTTTQESLQRYVSLAPRKLTPILLVEMSCHGCSGKDKKTRRLKVSHLYIHTSIGEPLHTPNLMVKLWRIPHQVIKNSNLKSSKR